jgi:hypothetical protein
MFSHTKVNSVYDENRQILLFGSQNVVQCTSKQNLGYMLTKHQVKESSQYQWTQVLLHNALC